MKFLAPFAFYFAAVLPVVVVFYLLKRKRVVKLISSTLLWQKFLADTQASAPFQKLRHNWLLILQLLLLLLVIFALARPYFPGQNTKSRLRVLILDASASMQSTDVKPNRFELARAQALKWVDGLRDTDQMVILQASANTEVKQSATSDKTVLRRALQSSRATDTPTRLVEAFKLAETLTRNRSDAEVHLFSDGAAPGLDSFEKKDFPLTYHRVGEGANNIGIISLDVRANPDDVTQRAIFVNIANFTPSAQPIEVELTFNGEALQTRSVTLPATNSLPLVFISPQTNDGVFSVRLVSQDDLKADNTASIVSLMPQPVRVLLVTRGNAFLERALRGAGNVQLTVVGAYTGATSAYDFVVLDDVFPVTWPDANVLAIHVSNSNWFPNVQAVKSPGIVDWKNTHPLLRSVNFDNVDIAETLGVKAPNWGVSLLESPQTPLVVAGEIDRHRVIWVGFDTLQSTWPLRVSYPIFIANAVEWLNPATVHASQLTMRTGDPFRLPVSGNLGQVTIVKPDGTKATLPVEARSRELVFGETFQQGLYRLQAGTNEIVFCANLVDAAESNIQPKDELPFGKYDKVIANTVQRANQEIWRWIAGFGLVVLMFEWWYYHRRTA